MNGTPPSSPPLLSVRNLTKRFGGVTASDGICLDIVENEIHAIIGPNGAGKTTLIAQLTGLLATDTGEIKFLGRDITKMAPHRRAQLGLARSFQITSVLRELSVLQNVALAVQATLGHSYRFWRPTSSDDALNGPALNALEVVGLAARQHDAAGAISHGEQRQLEIAMALATKPKLLLLDEPMAGMGPDEAVRIQNTLAAFKGEKTILLVEHDMDIVFQLADRISVLVYGKVIASGTPDAIRANSAVQAAYLGHAADESARPPADETSDAGASRC
ncbi:MAG: ABC transporter ATP-binding protein [Gammaproteobacteria bacterium]|nr:ABC transporter ATP-binding protein [Gammaproteobacteria bacterium]